MPKDAARGFIPELLALMPLSAREVLIAGSGDLAEAYRRRNPTARLTGVGPVADPVFDRFVTGDPGTLGKTRLAGGQGYDLVVLDGTLGQLRDPAALLRRLRGLIRPGGTLVASCANPGHWRKLSNLIGGKTDSREGLAQEGLQQLLKAAGFVLHRIRARRADIAAEAAPWLEALGQLGERPGLTLNNCASAPRPAISSPWPSSRLNRHQR